MAIPVPCGGTRKPDKRVYMTPGVRIWILGDKKIFQTAVFFEKKTAVFLLLFCCYVSDITLYR